jgi:signal transduction histidine kinase
MTTMISELLGFATLGGELRREPCPLQRIVADLGDDLAPALRAVGARIEAGPLPTVHADPVQLAAVLQNLVSNAAKYRHPARTPLITIQAAHEDGRWRIEVADNGMGIPAAEREAAFAPLHRLAQTAEREGVGIGLATCRRIITAHGGRIGLADTPGGGTTAWFTVPDGRNE